MRKLCSGRAGSYDRKESHMKRNNVFWGYVMVIVSAVIFGLMPLMTAVLKADGMNSYSIVMVRNLIPLPVLAGLALIQTKSLKVPMKALPSMSLAALMGCCATPLLLYISYDFLAPYDGLATVFHFVYPAFVVVGGLVFFKQKLTIGTWISLAFCIAGVCLFYDPNASVNLAGAGLALLSGVTYAIYVLILSAFQYKQINSFLFSFYLSCVTSVVMLVYCIATNQLVFPVSLGGWLMAVFFGLVVNVGAMVLFQKGTFLIGGQRSSILSTMEPLTSVVLVVFTAGIANIGMGTWIGSVLVIASTVLIAVFDAKKK